MDEEFNDVADDVPVDDTPEIEDVPEDIPEDVPEDIPEDVPEDVPEDIPEDAPEDVPKDIPEDVPEDVPKDIPEDVPKNVPEDIPEDVPEDVPEDIPEDVPEDVPKDVQSADTQGDVADETSTSETEDMVSDASTDEQPDDTQDDMTDEAAANETEDTVPNASADEQSDDTQDDMTDEAAANETEDTDPAVSADEQPDDTQDDMADEVSVSENEDTVPDASTDEQPDASQDDMADEAAANETEDTDPDMSADEQYTDVQSNTTPEERLGNDTYVEGSDSPVLTEKTPMEQLSDYMNSHNYGIGDYPEYSQDPEWQKLHNAAYPSETVAEQNSNLDITDKPQDLTEKTPMEQLSDYMNSHNYGIGDYPEYSQNPEWQKLHNAAYPSEIVAEQNSNLDIIDDKQLDAAQDDMADETPVDKAEDTAPDASADEQSIDTQDDTTDKTPAGETEDTAPDANVDEQPDDTQNDMVDEDPTSETEDTVPDASADTQDNLSKDNSNSHKESWNYDEWGPNPFADDKALARGEVADHVFNDKDVDDINRANLKLEDLSKNDYENLKQTNPQKASQLLTDYNDRNIMPDDLSSYSRHLDVENNDGLYVVDKDLSVDKATMRDVATGQEYSVYPNPMDRVSHMAGKQGQNDLGMRQDCGIASTAKGINDIYGKNVTSENRLANYAYDTHNCSIKNKPDGTDDIYNSGGTWEGNVKDFYNANGLSADMYVKDNVPSPDYIASRLKNGDVATLAVNHNLMWNWDKAQAFNPANVDTNRYATDPNYARYVDDLTKIQNGGVFQADHFVNVSNAVYDKNGVLTHFIVSDTGNGTTRMIEKDYLYRAYNGGGRISVSAQGCVIAGRR